MKSIALRFGPSGCLGACLAALAGLVLAICYFSAICCALGLHGWGPDEILGDLIHQQCGLCKLGRWKKQKPPEAA